MNHSQTNSHLHYLYLSCNYAFTITAELLAEGQEFSRQPVKIVLLVKTMTWGVFGGRGTGRERGKQGVARLCECVCAHVWMQGRGVIE